MEKVAEKITGTFKAELDAEEQDNAMNNNFVEEGSDLYDSLVDKEFSENRHQFLSCDGKFIYHIGIIDYLQLFNFVKQVEYYWKDAGSYKHLVSCVPPPFYAQRYFNFMQSEVIINQASKMEKKMVYQLEELAQQTREERKQALVDHH